MQRFRSASRVMLLLISLGLFSTAAHAINKNITVTLNSPTQAITTWYFASCTQSLGVGSYSVSVAPQHGSLSYSTVSGPIPGCPAGSPSLPAAAAFYTWTDTAAGAACDDFQLNFLLNGQVAEVDTVTVRLATGAPISITSTTLPAADSGLPYSDTLTSTGASDPVTWSVTSGSLPPGFTLSSGGVLSTIGSQPAAAGTYNFTATAASSCQSASQAYTLNVIPVNCSDNAQVDTSKIHVNTATPLNETPIYSQWIDNGEIHVRFGDTIPFEHAPFLNNAITITVDPDAVTYNGPSVPADQIAFKFIQNLTGWTGGYAVYEDRDTGESEPEWNSFLGSVNLNGVSLKEPIIDYNGGRSANPPWYDSHPYLVDSPTVSAPLSDRQRRLLRSMHYFKTFTAYFGCHTNQDLTTYTNTDPKHFLHTLAKITWGVNYYGLIRPCLSFDVACFLPDTSLGVLGTPDGPGVFYNKPVVDIEDPAMVFQNPPANGNTNYLCFGNLGVCP